MTRGAATVVFAETTGSETKASWRSIRPSRLVESEARRGESVVGPLSLVGQARKWHEFFGMSSFEAWLQSQGLQGAEIGQGSGGCFPKTPSAQILRT